VPLTLAHMTSILPRLRPIDVEEILGGTRHPSLEAWARSRVEIPGVAWAVLVDGVPMWCVGVLEGAVRGIGAMWLVGARGCEPYVKHVMRIVRVILSDGGFRRVECKCYADNDAANRFAMRFGFKFEGTLRGYSLQGKDINQYGVLP
jgi:hypothetical protein